MSENYGISTLASRQSRCTYPEAKWSREKKVRKKFIWGREGGVLRMAPDPGVSIDHVIP